MEYLGGEMMQSQFLCVAGSIKPLWKVITVDDRY